MVDYKHKQAYLTLKLDILQRRISKWYFRSLQETHINDQYLILDKKANMIKKFNKKYGKKAYETMELFNHAKYKRKIRIRDKTQNIVSSGTALFLTLTFTDQVLDSTNQLTRRRYVQRWCKSNSKVYVFNLDYGTLNQREHYHAILEAQSTSTWNYGFKNSKRIRTSGTDVERTSKYISKLTNHQIKKSASLSRIGYSR